MFAGFDGTPNESVADVLVRVRQVLSICETQYDGETIIFVAPDSTVLSVLQAALLGIDLRSHWGLEYRCATLCKVLCASSFVSGRSSMLAERSMSIDPCRSTCTCLTLWADAC